MADWVKIGRRRKRASVTLDASGNGTVTFDADSANHKWIIDVIVLSTNQAQTTSPYPTATTYVGGQQLGVSEGASWIANQDTMQGIIELGPCDTLTIQFTGGVTGSVATAIPEGDSLQWR